MMATEATSEILATSSTIPDHELNTVETRSQDVTSDQNQPVVNGNIENSEGKQDGENADENVKSADASVSGSDNEASKADASKITGEEKGHVRAGSTAKKFTSFKPVSVNKTFLAAKGATPTVPSKLGDKGTVASVSTPAGPSASAMSRPRLVAKSGSGLRDSTPRNATATNGGKPGSAPDASAVWNKNRPAPPPEPKKYTDEELKQQYGIHLATRLQSDEPGKQANWADIDEDEDDWAPETIEWTDGTKITLPQADETPAPEPVPVVLKDTKNVEVPKTSSPGPTQASASPLVKPGGLATGRAGLILKGAAEKPTLVAKPPGPPTPVKSPWAPLPPVEKVAPIAIETPQQTQHAQQGRFTQRDPHGFQGMPPPPAKEIAADDFSRSSWREGSTSSRELFNSQSGRYEPVNEGRRGSTRNDARGHQPAVLQRPSQQDGPAEPSPAFQTHRASGVDGAGYSRRRTSSNVSGGSGNLARRMSRGGHEMPPHELLNVRRESLAAVSDSPSSPRNFSPSGQQQNQRGQQSQAWQPSRASPVVSHQSPQSTHGQAVPSTAPASESPSRAVHTTPQEDPLEVQKKVMLQSRALAIKRRQEEEAKEEAARKERIRIKLEAMGPLPEKKKDTAKDEKPSPAILSAKPRETVSAPEPLVSSPSKTVAKVETPITSPPADISEKVNLKDSAEPSSETSAVILHPGRSSLSNSQKPSENRPTQSWQNVPPSSSSDRFRPWAQASNQQSGPRNVWGPPSNDRTLGNGTFNPELSRLPDMHTGAHPGPIGPPNSSLNQKAHANSNSNRGNARGRDYGSRPAPIGPPNKQDELRAAVKNSGWGALPSRIAQEDAALAQQQDAERLRRLELLDAGHPPELPSASIQETWHPVKMNEDGTRQQPVQAHAKVSANDVVASSWTPQEEPSSRGAFEEQGIPHRNTTVHHQSQFDTWHPSGPSAMPMPVPVRGSRFFPNTGSRDVRLEEQHVLLDRPGSPSPPPPTMLGHPAYDGDSAHPHVQLPRPSPVVKLPPPPVLAPIGPPKPTSFAAAVQAPVVPVVASNSASQNFPSRGSQYQDIRKQEPAAGGWQERINSLVGRKNSPPKSVALAVDSSSKSALEDPSQQIAATVSLPSLATEPATGIDTMESKPAAEECFEEQEMGSLPVIKVPTSAPPSAWTLALPQPKSLPRKFHVADATSVNAMHFAQHIKDNTITVTIKVPGQEGARSVTMPVPRQKSNPRRGGSRGGAPRQNNARGRGRDSSSSFASPSLDNTPSPMTPNSVRGGRSGRGYGSSWNRHTPTTVET